MFEKSPSYTTLRQPEVKLMAIGLLNFADDEGYFYADPMLIRGEIFPFLEDYRTIPVMLRELSGCDYIEIRDTVDGAIGKVVNFAKHQVVNKKTSSKLKASFEHAADQDCEAESADSGQTTVVLPEGDGKTTALSREQGKEGKGTEGSGATSVALARNAGEQPFEPEEEAEKKESPAQRIHFDYDTLQLQRIIEEDMEGWMQAYPAVALTNEIERAKQWLIANPAKRKKNVCRFLTNWLSKAQEKGGSMPSSSRMASPRLSDNDYPEGIKC